MKERFCRKILSVCLALLIIAALVPAQSISVSAYWDNYGQFSYEFTYVDRRWDYSQNKLVEEVKTHTGPYSELKFLWERWESSNLLYGICDVTPSDWYLVSWDVTISKRIDVIGNVNLVILDDHTVTFEDGIHVAPGSTLNIYGQSNDSGVLKAVADTNKQAAIGGNDGEACGTVNIYGGQVTADCYNYGNEAPVSAAATAAAAVPSRSPAAKTLPSKEVLMLRASAAESAQYPEKSRLPAARFRLLAEAAVPASVQASVVTSIKTPISPSPAARSQRMAVIAIHLEMISFKRSVQE